MQFIHEEDVGRALQLCIVGAGPPGAYNIAGDGVLTAADVAREFGRPADPAAAGPAQAAARAVARLPFLPPAAEWVEAAGRPVIMDTAKAREQLGWRPRFTGLEALRDTLAAARGLELGVGRGATTVRIQSRTRPRPLGHLQLGHVADAGQLEVEPGRVPSGDVAGGRDRDQPVLVAVDQQHRGVDRGHGRAVAARVDQQLEQ